MPTKTREPKAKRAVAPTTEPMIEIQERAPEWALAIRVRSTVDVIPQLMGELLGETWQAAERLGCRALMPFSRYFAIEGPGLDMESGFIVDGPIVQGLGRVEVVRLPGGEMAVATHVGPYDRLHETYHAMEGWLAEQGRIAGGPMWEVYLDDPQSVAPEALRTEVVIPLD